MAETSTLVWVRPSEVLYSQESISAVFKSGQQTIEETFRRLVEGKTPLSDVRQLTVFRFRNKLWVHNGNKRLFIFRKLEEFGLVENIQVNLVSRSPFESGDVDVCNNTFTTVNGGNDVIVRGPGGCRISGTLATIYRKSVSRRQAQCSPSTPSRPRLTSNADSSTSPNGSSSFSAKRRSVHPLKLRPTVTSSIFSWPRSSAPPPQSPYPQSPAVIANLLPYCVVFFGLVVFGLISLLLFCSDFWET